MSSGKYRILIKLIFSLWHEERSFKIRFVFGSLLIFITAGFTLALPWTLKKIIDFLAHDSIIQGSIFILISYGILWLLSQVFVVVRQIAVYRIFERGVHKLGLEVFQKLLSLPLSYHIDRSTGAMLNTIEMAQAALPDVLFGLMFVILPMVIEIIIACFLIGYCYDLKYVMIIISLFVVYFAFTWSSIGWIVSAQRKGNKEDKNVSSFIAEILMNIEYVHYNSYRNVAINECSKRMSVREVAVTNKLIKIDFVYLGQVIIAGIGFIILTILVGKDIASHNLVVSDFVLFNGYLIQFLMPLNVIGISVLRRVREGLTRMEDVMDILLLPSPTTEITSNEALPEVAASIEFRNVSFKYPEAEGYALQDVNLNIEAGKTIALVGANGTGKSTIVKLLYRLYEPANGEILLNQQSIKNYSLESLRSHIGIVPQETLLLNDTLYANLTMNSNIHIESDHFQHVMQEVKIADWVKDLPEGYNTPIGERGVKLSGGERQRIALARVLLRKPKVIIMDEATSAIDEKTEHEIFTQLKNKFTNISKVIITHNSKNLSFADEVFLLE